MRQMQKTINTYIFLHLKYIKFHIYKIKQSYQYQYFIIFIKDKNVNWIHLKMYVLMCLSLSI